MVAEKNRVWRLGGSIFTICLQRMDEAEIEHLVGLVEHEDLDLAQAQEALLDEVDQAARGGDQDVDAAGDDPGGSCAARCRRTRSRPTAG